VEEEASEKQVCSQHTVPQKAGIRLTEFDRWRGKGRKFSNKSH